MTDAIAPMLGRIPSGLFILTVRGPQGEETGMLASWVQQAGFTPPSLTVAVSQERYLRAWLTPGTPIALNQLAETQKPLLAHFGKGFEPGAPAFEGLEIERSPAGLMVLKDSLGWLEGTVSAILPAGDHDVVLVELTGGATGPRHAAAEKPWVHLRKNGLKY